MSAGAEPVDRVGPMAMSIVSAEPSHRAEERWAQRTETLAAWLAGEWKTKWISPNPRGKDRPRDLPPSTGAGDGNDEQ